MNYREEQRDLFTVPQGYMLAHCISADFALGAGIAKAFVEIYDMRDKLFAYGRTFWDGNIGRAVQIENVFNLITKHNGYDRPTMEDLRAALEDMRDKMIEQKMSKLAMPMIGCGLDRLSWESSDDYDEDEGDGDIGVRGLIQQVFEYTDIEILVCVL